MAANFSAAVPVETEKAGYIHERAERPVEPQTQRDWGRFLLLIVLGIAFTAAFVALAFQTRAGWDDPREWVVATTVPFYAIAGVGLAYLFVRRAWVEATPALGMLATVLTFTIGNLARAAETSGPDDFRDGLSIATGIFLGLTVLAVLVAVVLVEWRNPTRPPAPKPERPGRDAVCRSIKRLRGPSGPATPDQVREASLQYVRKVSGFRQPSSRNSDAFEAAVADVAAATERLLAELPE